MITYRLIKTTGLLLKSSIEMLTGIW